MEIFGSFSPAWKRMQDMLFRPFNLGGWFALGFVFFLQALVEGGLGNRYNFNGGGSGGRTGTGAGAPPPSFVDVLEQLRKLVHDNAGSLTILIVTGSLIGLVTVVLFSWLGTRGQMMAIRNVARGEASVGDAWRDTAEPAFALFKFRLILSAIGLVITVPLFVLAISRTYELIDGGVRETEALLIGLIPFVVVIGGTGLVLGAVESIVRNFVAPLMWRFEIGVGEGFSRFLELASGRWLSVLGFLVVRFVASMIVGLVDTVVVTCTCCIGALPVVHQTLFAPWHVLERAWSLYFIESAGVEWTMVDPMDAPPPAAGFPPPPAPPPGGWGAYGPPPPGGPRWPGQ